MEKQKLTPKKKVNLNAATSTEIEESPENENQENQMGNIWHMVEPKSKKRVSKVLQSWRSKMH